MPNPGYEHANHLAAFIGHHGEVFATSGEVDALVCALDDYDADERDRLSALCGEHADTQRWHRIADERAGEIVRLMDELERLRNAETRGRMTLRGSEIVALNDLVDGDSDATISIAYFEASTDVETGETMPKGETKRIV